MLNGDIYYFFHILFIILYGVNFMGYHCQYTFYINLIRYCAAYFEYVRSEIHVLGKRLESDQRFTENVFEIQQALKKVIKVHQKALNFSSLLNRSVRWFIFAVFSLITICMCLLLLVFSIVGILIYFQYFSKCFHNISLAKGRYSSFNQNVNICTDFRNSVISVLFSWYKINAGGLCFQIIKSNEAYN